MSRIRHALGSGATIPVIQLLAWAAAAHFGLLDVRLWSSPELVALGGWGALRDGTLLAALGASLTRDVTGFAIGAVAGLILGLLLARVRLADRLLSPTLNTVRQIALFAWVPFLSLWLGNDEAGRIAFIALAAFFPVLVNTYLGAAQVEARYLDVARTLCLRPHRVLLKVILPSAFPTILTGLRLGLIYAWLATIGAEYLFATTTGIGSMMMDARDLFRMDLVILGMAVIGGVGFVMNLSIGLGSARLFSNGESKERL
jgi:sulfonate transport system permease protein